MCENVSVKQCLVNLVIIFNMREILFNRDILTLREIAKKNYIMYYVQENLLDLQGQQQQEQQLMDNVETFQKVCNLLFF